MSPGFIKSIPSPLEGEGQGGGSHEDISPATFFSQPILPERGGKDRSQSERPLVASRIVIVSAPRSASI